MDRETRGKSVSEVEVRQPKNLNIPVKEFTERIKGKRVNSVSSRGKWLLTKLEPDEWLLINLGMGAELVYFEDGQKLPEKHHFKLVFSDKTGFTAHFWWFGYIHLTSDEELPKHKMTASLGMSPTDEDFTLENFRRMLQNKKVGVKSFLLDQKNVAGIGNVYVQDMLFKAKLHPNKKVSALSDQEIGNLYTAMKENLNRSIELGGTAYEVDFYGKKGKYTSDNFLVAYKMGKPCPVCGATIQKIKTGSTASYICPECQKLA